MHDRKDYRLDPKPLIIGGQAEVFLGVRKSDGLPIAFKRRISDLADARTRMRREIEVQSALDHENVMPVLDFDDVGHAWYVMPRGTQTLLNVPVPIDDAELRVIVTAVLRALEAAHASDHPNRDVKPSNVIEISHGAAGTRWVLADWGMTRRAHGETTTDLTVTGMFVGTPGWAPPEAYVDAHAIGPKGDLYGLGHLIAWAKTGKPPVPNMPGVAPEPWRRLVKLLTQQGEADRPESAAAVLAMLDTARSAPAGETDITALLERARRRDVPAGIAACLAVLDRDGARELLLDEIAQLDHLAEPLVMKHPKEALLLVRAMDDAFHAFGHRNFNYANVPLGWMHSIAVAAAKRQNLVLLEDVCDVLFPLEAGWDRFGQRDVTVDWLRHLGEPAAGVVAACLRTHAGMRKYLGGRINDAASASVRDAMRGE